MLSRQSGSGIEAITQAQEDNVKLILGLFDILKDREDTKGRLPEIEEEFRGIVLEYLEGQEDKYGCKMHQLLLQGDVGMLDYARAHQEAYQKADFLIRERYGIKP